MKGGGMIGGSVSGRGHPRAPRRRAGRRPAPRSAKAKPNAVARVPTTSASRTLLRRAPKPTARTLSTKATTATRAIQRSRGARGQRVEDEGADEDRHPQDRSPQEGVGLEEAGPREADPQDGQTGEDRDDGGGVRDAREYIAPSPCPLPRWGRGGKGSGPTRFFRIEVRHDHGLLGLREHARALAVPHPVAVDFSAAFGG